MVHSLFLHPETKAAFLYIACTEWSRDESSETFSAIIASVDLRSPRAPAIPICAARQLGVRSSSLGRGALLRPPAVLHGGPRNSGPSSRRAATCGIAVLYAARCDIQGDFQHSTREPFDRQNSRWERSHELGQS
jgi:hypothetical protein